MPVNDMPPRPPHPPNRCGSCPLGGVGEIGKALTIFEYGDEIVVIDCGLAFPDEEMFGIDLVIPDITYLKERRHKVKAFLITHAHEDHVGGLPYVLPSFPGVPVYASTLARGLLGTKIKEHKLRDNPVLRASTRVTPSTWACSRPAPSASVTPSPMPWASASGRPSATSSTPATSSSTRPPWTARAPTSTSWRSWAARACSASCPTPRAPRAPATHRPSAPSARRSGGSWKGLQGRVIVATFASNIARIQQVFDAAGEFGRKVAVIGRSMEQNTRIAADLGYLHWGAGQQVPKDRLKDVPDDQICIATTGSQGEPMAGLARMANRDHRFVEIVPGDTVIVSASPIPGNEE